MNLHALFKISYGLYVITSTRGERVNGQIANTVFQITSEPPTLAVSINKENLTHKFISESRSFAVNVLDQRTDMTFIGRFGFRSGRDMDKFDGLRYRPGKGGNPILEENSVAYTEVKVEKEVDMGSHTIFIGEVMDADVLTDGEPMTYAHYRLIKGGKAPKAAPTYLKE